MVTAGQAGVILSGLCGSMRRMQRGALLVALAAMVLRALLPAGMMVAPESGKIVICTGQGAVERPTDQPGKPAKSADGICLFATQTIAAPAPASFVLAAAAFPVAAGATLGRPQAIIPGRGLAAPPPPAQAPPQLV
jgi:hypothetical protein